MVYCIRPGCAQGDKPMRKDKLRLHDQRKHRLDMLGS